MNAVKTKSGKWRAQYVAGYIYLNGKRKVIRKSVTRDGKREAENAARELEHSIGKSLAKRSDMTVSECVSMYIELKEPVLSPSTIRAYRALERNAYETIGHLKPNNLEGPRLQRWVNEYSRDHSPKAVRNAHALLVGAIKECTDISLSATLPQKQIPKLYTPSDAEIEKLLKSIKGTELEKAVILASQGTLRRGEVCGLVYEDIHGNTIHVHRTMVETSGGGTTIKNTTKTPQSDRQIQLPAAMIKILLRDVRPGEQVVKMTPTAISCAFSKAVKRCGLPHFRFHDLRAYAASIMHALGIPDAYIMKAGGWKSDVCLKNIYRRALPDKEDEFTTLINEYFEEKFA